MIFKTVVLGVNDHEVLGDENIISNASCTTNNAAPMISVNKSTMRCKASLYNHGTFIHH